MVDSALDGENRERNRKGRWARSESQSIRDIGPPPKCVNESRRDAAIADPVVFLRTYFPGTFDLPFCDDHHEVIGTLERVVINGGLFALAMPRGSGKTQISIRMALRAILLGRRRYAAIIGAAEGAARRIIKALRTELTWNELLYEDFPAELHGIPQLQGDNRRAGGQLCRGQKTSIEMGVSQIVFPTLDESGCSGSVIAACGLTGNLRGQFHTLPTGEVIRPDLAIPDDPQTKESAKSAAQTQERQEILEGDVLGLAGPGRAIACVMPCTVIAPDDLADRMLKHPLWNGKRTKTLYSFPTDLKLWDEYFQIRAEGLRVEKSSDAGNAFYEKRQADLETGAVAGWPARVLDGDLSAVQSAMHLWYRSPAAFAAEYQNEPVDLTLSEERPRCHGVETKLTRLRRGEVPLWATRLTAGIDVQQRLLYYVVIAWRDDFSGAVVDYGAYPDQPRAYFTLGDAHPTLESASGIPEPGGSLVWGLRQLTDRLAKPWKQGDGSLSIDRVLLDTGWSSDLIYRFLERTPHKFLMPAKGEGVTAGKRAMDEWSRKPGEQHGLNWVVSSADNTRKMRRVKHDVNWWKTFLAGLCAAPEGSPGSLAVFGEKQEQHRLLVDHWTAESCTKTFGNGREVWEWHNKPGVDNHLFDCGVMATVAASISGVSLDHLRSVAKAKSSVKFSELQKARK